MRAVISVGALSLAAACAHGPDADGGIPANRHILFEGERFGYYQYDVGGDVFDISEDWNPTESVITIVSREGRAVTDADRDIAARLARELCEEDGRVFNTRSRGTLLRRGGISFAGDCREW